METTLTDCTCVCNEVVQEVVKDFDGTPLQIALVVIIVIIIIVLFFVGFRKLSTGDEDEDLGSDNTYY